MAPPFEGEHPATTRKRKRSELLPPGTDGVVFDVDGTLLNTLPSHWEAWSMTAKAFGLDYPMCKFIEWAGMPSRVVFQRLCEEQGKKIDIEAALEWKKCVYQSSGLKNVRPIDCVLKILLEAKTNGIPVAIASGGTRSNVLKGLEACELLEYFEDDRCIITSEMYSNPKPHPEPFLLAAEAIGVDPSRCCGLEDADLGLQAISEAFGNGRGIDVRLLEGYPVFAS